MLVGAPPLLGQQARARDRDARLVGGGLEDLEVLLAERVGLGALHHEHADRLPVHPERDVHFGAAREAREVLRLAPHVGGVVQPAVLHRLGAQAFAGVHPHRNRRVGPADARLEHAIARGVVEQEHAEEVVAERFVVEPGDHAAVHHGLVVGGRDAGAEPEQGGLAPRDAAAERAPARASLPAHAH